MNQLRANEIFAKIVLENVFPMRFNELKIEDKPDLIEEKNKIGVEVVSIIDSKREKFNNDFNTINNMPDSPRKEKYKKNLKERAKTMGVSLSPFIGKNPGTHVWGGMIGPCRSFEHGVLEENHPAHRTLDYLEKKLKKIVAYKEHLITKYNEYSSIDLCIDCHATGIDAISSVCPELLVEMKQLQDSYDDKFSHIYLICNDSVADIDLAENSYGIVYVHHILLGEWLSDSFLYEEAGTKDGIMVEKTWKTEGLELGVVFEMSRNGRIYVERIDSSNFLYIVSEQNLVQHVSENEIWLPEYPYSKTVFL